MIRRPLPLLALLVALGALGCERSGETVSWSFERMIDQPSVKAYEPSSLFADSMGMRTPPPGTVPRDAPVGPRAVLTGRVGAERTVAAIGATRTAATEDVARDTPVGPIEGTAAAGAPPRRQRPAVERIPIPLTIADLQRGQDRFDIFCAPCHGVDGQAETPVASKMPLQPPPALVSDAIRSVPDGHIFSVITEGYGFMPSYAAELSIHDRWAVVAYVRALQLAQRAPLDSLPDSLRAAFRAAVPGGTPLGGGRP